MSVLKLLGAIKIMSNYIVILPLFLFVVGTICIVIDIFTNKDYNTREGFFYNDDFYET